MLTVKCVSYSQICVHQNGRIDVDVDRLTYVDVAVFIKMAYKIASSRFERLTPSALWCGVNAEQCLLLKSNSCAVLFRRSDFTTKVKLKWSQFTAFWCVSELWVCKVGILNWAQAVVDINYRSVEM